MSKQFESRIRTKKAKVAVIGLGYIGLPLAVGFAKAGFRVYGIDTNEDRVNRVNNKKSYIKDVNPKTLATVINSQKFSAHLDFSLLKDADAIIICVPTPLKRKYTPDISFIMDSVRRVRKNMSKGALIVLESTTYPGTTDEMIRPALEKGGKKHGRDFFLAFSPERIDPGNKKYEVTKIPKIIGGVSKRSAILTQKLYSKVIKEVHIVSSAKAAEMTKLLENTFRIVNIGWINEMTQMCHKMDIDVWEVIEAAKTKPFGFMPFYPGLGVGGHCIPDDPLYLYWKARSLGYNSKFIKLSADINHSMPEYAIERLKKALKTKKKTLSRSKILVLGATYKKDVADLRKSPALTLIEMMQKNKAKVDYYDPLIPYLKFPTLDKVAVKPTQSNLKKYDCVVIAVHHSKVNYNLILKHARLVFDIPNVYGNKNDKKIIRF